jgi:CelD/BcsL family acetyltransferase involved in cellulose biosynthesis
VLLARLDPVKRVEDFLDAAAIVTPLVEGARFLVVGDDVITTKRGQRPESPYRKELLSHAARIGLADRVIFTGMRFDVSRLLAQADVSVLCSSSEGLSNTILESMAAGLPVVATDVGGTAEIVDDGQTGLLVRPFQPASIAGAIVRLLQEPELARRLGRAGREKVERHFTLRRMVSETERLYERLLEQHHSRTAGSGHLTLRDRPEPASPSSSVSFAVTPSTAVTSEAHRDEVTIATVADVGGFAALRDEWTELLSDSRADCLFLTWEWLFTWWKHFGHGRQLSILTVRSGARLVAVAPLVAQRSGPLGFWTLSTLEFLGRGSVGSDYLDIIVRNGYEDQALSVLASRLALQNVGVSFAQVRMGRRLRRDRAAAMNLARSLSARRWRVVCAVTDVCPYIDLRGHSWTSYLDSVGPALRYNFRRRLRNLEKMGPVRFEPAVTPADCRVSLDRLIDFHNRRWIEKGGSQAFHQPALVEFHREFTPLALERGWLRMLSLTIGDTPVSLLYCLRYGRSFLGYQSGFDVQYRRHSVGLVSVGLAIRMAIGEGADEYDFLHGNEGYKDHWSSHRRQLARLDLFPSHFRGAVGHRGFELHNFARRMAKGFIQRVRPAEAGSKNSNEAP